MRDPRVASNHLSRDAYLYIRQSTLRQVSEKLPADWTLKIELTRDDAELSVNTGTKDADVSLFAMNV